METVVNFHEVCLHGVVEFDDPVQRLLQALEQSD